VILLQYHVYGLRHLDDSFGQSFEGWLEPYLQQLCGIDAAHSVIGLHTHLRVSVSLSDLLHTPIHGSMHIFRNVLMCVLANIFWNEIEVRNCDSGCKAFVLLGQHNIWSLSPNACNSGSAGSGCFGREERNAGAADPTTLL
jgi:hypothetical protein